MERIKEKKLLIVIVLSAIIVASLIGYWYWSSTTKKPLNLRLGYMPIVDDANLFVALEQGFFKEEGLNVTLTQFVGGPQVVEAVAAGSIDGGHAGIVPALMGIAGGIPLMMMTATYVDPEHEVNAWVVRENSSIKSVSDVKGKIFALHSTGGLNWLVDQVILERYGLTKGDLDVRLIPMAKHPEVLIGGTVDIADAFEPFVTFLLQKGGFRILTRTLTQVYPDHRWDYTTIVFTKDFVDKNKGVIDAFLRANAKALSWIKDHPEETSRMIAKYLNLEYELVKAMGKPGWLEKLDRNGVQREVELMLKYGWIKEPIDIDKHIYSP